MISPIFIGEPVYQNIDNGLLAPTGNVFVDAIDIDNDCSLTTATGHDD